MAGSSTTAIAKRVGALNERENRPVGVGYDLVADDADASIPNHTFHGMNGGIVAIDVVFPAEDSVNELTVTPRTIDGVSLAEFFPSLTFSGSGRIKPEETVPFSGGLVSSNTGNATNGGKAKVIYQII